jgi:cytochrome P450
VSLPPGPSAPPLIQTLEWAYRPGEFMERCQRRHGDLFSVRVRTFRVPGEDAQVVFVSDPAAVKSIFTGGAELARVSDSRSAMRPVFGERSVLLTDGDEHLHRRKLMLPAFHGERMTRYGELMAEIADAELDSWPVGRPLALHPGMQRITLEVILRAVFGLDEGRAHHEVRQRIAKLAADVANPLAELAMALPERVGDVLVRLFGRTVEAVDEALYREIARRRDDPLLEQRDDILSQLVLARDPDGGAMSDQELRDQLVTLLLAGHETTATTMAWVMELLFQNPAAHRRLEEECASDDASGDAYLDAVIQEAMRLYPPLPAIDRVLAAPFEIGGYELPAGTIVAPCIYLAHRRPEVYPDPTAFRPERFLERPPETYSWIPFGGGIRRCLGASFATFEMRVVLRTLLRRATLRPASARPERVYRRSIVIAPRRGVRAILHGRRDATTQQRARELASVP